MLQARARCDFPLQSKLTLAAPNAGPFVPPVVISEIAYDPAQGPEYLVLTNRSDQVVPLYDPAVAGQLLASCWDWKQRWCVRAAVADDAAAK